MSALNCRVVEMKTNKVKSQPRMFKPLVAAIPSELTGLNKHFQKRGSDKWEEKGFRLRSDIQSHKWNENSLNTSQVHPPLKTHQPGSCLYLLTIPVVLSLKYGFIKWPKNTFAGRFLPSPAFAVFEPSSSHMISFCNTRMNWTASVAPSNSWSQRAGAEPPQTFQAGFICSTRL